MADHDEAWGRPVTDDTQLFEMLTLEAFQAGLSWLTILRKRDAFRAAFRGFDPHVVAEFDDADRERLMADAGIVRNRAKIDATIIERARFPRVGGGLADRSTRTSRPSLARRHRPCRDGSGRRHPGHDTRFRSVVARPQAPRFPFRRLDDRVCVHAGGRLCRRPPAGLLPLRRGVGADRSRLVVCTCWSVGAARSTVAHVTSGGTK